MLGSIRRCRSATPSSAIVFTESHREQAQRAGIDVELSYRLLQLEIRMGGPVCQRIEMAMMGLHYENNNRPEGRNITDHYGSMTDNHHAAEPSAVVTALTPAELRALGAVVDHGYSTIAARAIGLTPHTLSDQLKMARRKLGAKNTTHAVAIAIRQGLI